MKQTFVAGVLASVVTTAIAAVPVMAGEIRVDGFPPFDTHFDKQVPLFNENLPDIAVSYQMNDHGDHHKKLTTNLATQSGAGDVVIVDVSYVGAFINAGGFVNLSEEPYNAAQFKDGFVPYAWNQGQGADGNQYGIPIDIGPGVMYYRRDWLLGHLQNWMAPDTAGKWGASDLPGGIYGSWGGSFLAIPTQSENPAEAWEFIKYLTTEQEPQIDSLRDLGAFPVLLRRVK